MSNKTLVRLLPIVTFILGMFVVGLTVAVETGQKNDTGFSPTAFALSTVFVDNHNGNFSVPFILFNNYGNGTDSQIDYTQDLNYDGLTDVAANGTYISNGDGTWTRINTSPATAMSQYTRTGDLNGDGIIDNFDLSPATNSLRGRATLGGVTGTTGAQEAAKWNLDIDTSTVFAADDYLAKSWNLIDVNGDSLSDLIISYVNGGEMYKKMYLNNGHGWDLVVDYYAR